MIAHNAPTIGQEEEDAAVRVTRSGWLSSGRETENFEAEFCAFLGLPKGHAVAVSSGTAALCMTLQVLGAKGKTVVIPSYVCASLRLAAEMAGAEPQVIDTLRGTPNLDLNAASALQPAFAIVPHIFGLPQVLKKTAGTTWIEDCAQSLGAKADGVPTGLQGDVGMYSFFTTKIMTSGGQGGMIVSKNTSWIENFRDYRNFDARTDRKPRFNFCMTELQAAIGRAQLKKLPGFLARRAEIFRRYRDAGLELLDVPAHPASALEPVRFRAVLKTADPSGLIRKLKEKGIEAVVPLGDTQLSGTAEAFPNARELTRNIVSLPIFPALKDQEVDQVIAAVKEASR